MQLKQFEENEVENGGPDDAEKDKQKQKDRMKESIYVRYNDGKTSPRPQDDATDDSDDELSKRRKTGQKGIIEALKNAKNMM